MQKVVTFFNRNTNSTFPAGVFGDIFDDYCLKHPDEFDYTYQEDTVTEEKRTVYKAGELKGFSMKDLRDLYKILAGGKDDPPPPTTSVDGIIKAILAMQED